MNAGKYSSASDSSSLSSSSWFSSSTSTNRTIINFLAPVLLLFYLAGFAIRLSAIFHGRYKFSGKQARALAVDSLVNNTVLPGVSILKPLKGGDENLYENLDSYFNIDYPSYEILFCVQGSDDPSVIVVKNLISKYPNIEAKLYTEQKIVCVNPKINNLVQCYQDVKYDYILISDSGIKTTKDALYDMMVTMKSRNVGMVHQMPYCCERPGFEGLFEKVCFGTWSSRYHLVANLIGVSCVTGMSNLLKKSILDECGGLLHFGQYAAEDYFYAKAYKDRSQQILLSHQPAMQNAAAYSLSIWRKRILRWNQLRVRQSLLALMEPLFDCFFMGIYSSIICMHLYFEWSSKNTCLFFAFHVLLCFLLDYTLIQIIENWQFKHGMLACLPAWLYRETLCYLLYCKAILNSKVNWRSVMLNVQIGGVSELMNDNRMHV